MSINNVQASVIIKEIPTDGHSPLLIIGSDYKKYVAKNGKGQNPPITVINECLANHLLKCWDLPAPEFSLVHFSKELIQANELSKFHRPGVYDELAFGSAYLENVTDVNDFSFAKRKSTFNKFNNPLDFFRIALFDTWIENDDRRPTNYNLLFQSVDNLFNIIPIDHAFIFSTLNYDDLNPDNFWPSSNEHLLVSELAYLFKKYIRINDDLIRNEKQYFYFCVDKCEKTVDNFIAELAHFIEFSEESRIKIRRFLFNKERNKKVFDEYVYRLKQ
jgi:hypothetical protein